MHEPKPIRRHERVVHAGFIPLLDCAPLVIARERGFDTWLRAMQARGAGAGDLGLLRPPGQARHHHRGQHARRSDGREHPASVKRSRRRRRSHNASNAAVGEWKDPRLTPGDTDLARRE